MNKHHYQSVVGWIELTEENGAITSLTLGSEPENVNCSDSPVIRQCCKELDEYFEGERTCFDVKVTPKGTAFQQKVWAELMNIPYGKTISYARLAQNCNQPKACRAVGSANGKNPVAIIIPCHRVIASDGKLGGYAYGIDVKRSLLILEKGDSFLIDN